MSSDRQRTPTYRRYYRRARRQGHGRLMSALLAYPAKHVADVQHDYQQHLNDKMEEINEAKESDESTDWDEVIGVDR